MNAESGTTTLPVRVGHIEFLNCYPLYFGLEQRAKRTAGAAAAGGAAGRGVWRRRTAGGVDFELVSGVPTDLNRMLLAGTIDFGPISSIAYARNHRVYALSRRLSISSSGAVDSIQLVAKKPLEAVENIALTPKSATSIALLKTILSLRYGRPDMDYRELLGPVKTALEGNDAVLLIGDEGLEAMHFPRPEAFRYDLGDLWYEWVGLPMVYAVWATRLDFLRRHGRELRAVDDELVASMDEARQCEEQMVESAVGLCRFDRPCLSRYFRVLHYGFSADYQAGLLRFFELAHEAGELAEVPELRFLDDVPEVDPAAGAEAVPGA
jgi:chorismate dehydratase